MSKVAWFLGGTLAGAAVLATAAYFLSDDDDYGHSTSLDSSDSEGLDALLRDDTKEDEAQAAADNSAESMAFSDDVQAKGNKKAKKSADSQESEDSFDAPLEDAATA